MELSNNEYNNTWLFMRIFFIPRNKKQSGFCPFSSNYLCKDVFQIIYKMIRNDHLKFLKDIANIPNDIWLKFKPIEIINLSKHIDKNNIENINILMEISEGNKKGKSLELIQYFKNTCNSREHGEYTYPIKKFMEVLLQLKMDKLYHYFIQICNIHNKNYN